MNIFVFIVDKVAKNQIDNDRKIKNHYLTLNSTDLAARPSGTFGGCSKENQNNLKKIYYISNIINSFVFWKFSGSQRKT